PPRVRRLCHSGSADPRCAGRCPHWQSLSSPAAAWSALVLSLAAVEQAAADEAEHEGDHDRDQRPLLDAAADGVQRIAAAAAQIVIDTLRLAREIADRALGVARHTVATSAQILEQGRE